MDEATRSKLSEIVRSPEYIRSDVYATNPVTGAGTLHIPSFIWRLLEATERRGIHLSPADMVEALNGIVLQASPAEMAQGLANLPLSPALTAKAMLYGTDLSLPDVAQALADGLDLGAPFIARALADESGLQLAPYEIAMALHDGMGLSDGSIAWALQYGAGLNLSVGATMLALADADGLHRSPAAIVQAFRSKDGPHLPAATIKEWLQKDFWGLGLSPEVAAQALQAADVVQAPPVWAGPTDLLPATEPSRASSQDGPDR